MKILEKEIVQLQSEHRTLNDMHNTKPLLQYLVSFFTTLGLNSHTNHHGQAPPQGMTTNKILSIALEALYGCVEITWNDVELEHTASNAETMVNAFLDRLRVDAKDCFAFLQVEYIPVILNSCMRCPPRTWAKIIAPNCTFHDPTPNGTDLSICICTTLLFHTSKFSTHFPSKLFWDGDLDKKAAQAKWEDLLVDAAIPGTDVMIAHNYFFELCTVDKTRFAVKLLDGSEESKKEAIEMKNERKMAYCRAISYLMLKGNSEVQMALIKAM